MSNDLIERLGKLQDACNLQELGALDEDDVFELAGQTADEIERLEADCTMKDKRIDWTVADNAKKAMRIAELEAKVTAQAKYIMVSNRVNNNLKKQLARESDE